MAISREFSDMLNEHLDLELVNKSFEDRCEVYKKLKKDNKWKGGTLPVPIKNAQASSLKFGGYTADDDLSYSDYLRGEISGYKTLTYALPFKHRDIVEHNGRVNKDSFLKLLVTNLEDAMMFMKNAVSINLLNGGWYDIIAADGTAGGVVTVTNVQRFQLGQKIKVSAAAAGYVTAIDVNAKQLTIKDARTSGSAIDLSGELAGEKIYLDGQDSEAFFSIKEALLPAAEGGSDTLHGLTKATAGPGVQAPNYDGSSMTASNILNVIFDAYTDVRRRTGAGNANEIWMSWKHLGSVMKALESQKSPFRTKEGSLRSTSFGFTEIEIFTVSTGQSVKVVGVPEMDDDWMAMIDWNAFKFHSNGGFRKVKTPDGNEFYTVRGTTGYTFITDLELYGDLSAGGVSMCGAIHSISY